MPVQQQAPGAAGRVPAPELPVPVEVEQSLAEQVAHEMHRHPTHPAPALVSIQRAVDIESGGLVLKFFRAVPLPQGLESGLGVCKQGRVAQQPIGKQCGEMFVGGGDGQGVTGGQALQLT
jgi:hypothetical protein